MYPKILVGYDDSDQAKDALALGAQLAEATPSSSPARGLHELAEEIGADLILVGSAAYGRLRRVLLGSVSRQLVRTAPCPLIVTPRGIHAGSDSAERVEVEAET